LTPQISVAHSRIIQTFPNVPFQMVAVLLPPETNEVKLEMQ